jgi:hypothetical protein
VSVERSIVTLNEAEYPIVNVVTASLLNTSSPVTKEEIDTVVSNCFNHPTNEDLNFLEYDIM